MALHMIAIVVATVLALLGLLIYIGVVPPSLAQSLRDNFMVTWAIFAAAIYACELILYKTHTER